MPVSVSMYGVVCLVCTVVCMYERGTGPGDQLMTWHADFKDHTVMCDTTV